MARQGHPALGSVRGGVWVETETAGLRGSPHSADVPPVPQALGHCAASHISGKPGTRWPFLSEVPIH